jgi:hypothetical protein
MSLLKLRGAMSQSFRSASGALAGLLPFLVLAACSQSSPRSSAGSQRGEASLASFIDRIEAVDNHSHINTVVPADSDADALPLDGIPYELPAPLRPDSPSWRAAFASLYGYPFSDMSVAHMATLRTTMQRIAKTKADSFPTWVLDEVGVEVLLANRIAMGPGLGSSRFRWVSYVDALLLPLSNATEAATAPDRAKLFPLEEKLLRRYLADLHVAKLPATLEAYVRTVVTPTLESQRKAGCVAVKFEAGYLRALDFGDAPTAAASAIYAKYIAGGTPTHAEYKLLQDYLFRTIAHEAGRLGMAVHIHALEGFGNGYVASGSDPLLLEPTFNDTTLHATNFVILHGGGVFASHTAAMLWKPNVYADLSMLTLAYTPEQLAGILRGWLSQFPEKVLYGSDAVTLGPDMGWEVAAAVASRNARTALAMALTDMVRNGDVTNARAQEIATMVLRTNASRLYKLGLK